MRLPDDIRRKHSVTCCDFSKVDRTQIKNVILELSLDEFELIIAAWANMSYDCAAGPHALDNHPLSIQKCLAILQVLKDCKLSDSLSEKFRVMTDKLGNTKDI